MHKSQKEKFEKWEAKKRQEMGDVSFFQKYIPLYRKLDKIIKCAYLIGVCFLFLATIWRTVLLVINFNYGNFMFAIFSFILFISWVLLNVMYFFYASDCIYGDRIMRWEKEQERQSPETKKDDGGVC